MRLVQKVNPPKNNLTAICMIFFIWKRREEKKIENAAKLLKMTSKRFFDVTNIRSLLKLFMCKSENQLPACRTFYGNCFIAYSHRSILKGENDSKFL